MDKSDSTQNSLDLSRFEEYQEIKSDLINDVIIVKEKNTKDLYLAKISHAEITRDAPFQNNILKQESNVLSKITHPSIIKLIGFSPIDFHGKSKNVMITEYCSKGCLKTFFDIENKHQFEEINITQKLIILFGIASGMNYLHSKKIIFRNLNAENILLDDNLYPKICGFQLANQCNGSLYLSSIEGSPSYIAPEIYEKGEYSEASDVYAFSIVAYQLMTGQIPYQKLNINEICEKVKGKQRPCIEFEIPEAYKNIIQACWSQDKEKRPSFNQIVKQLKEDQSFITEKVNKEEFLKYVHFIENSKIEFNADKSLVEIAKNLTQQLMTPQLIEILKRDLNKLKYFVIEEARRELTQIDAYYSNFNLFDSHFDLNRLKDHITQIFLKISGASKEDSKITAILKSINETIEKEYKVKYNKLNKLNVAKKSSIILDQIIIMVESIDPDETTNSHNVSDILVKINKMINDCKGELMFDKKKIQEISSSEKRIVDIVNSLKATKQIIDKQIKEETSNINHPSLSILYSPDKKVSSDAQSLSNILKGDCYFVTLFGNPTCTRNVLNSISNKNLNNHQSQESITIYGPCNIVQFGRTVTNSIEKLRQFISKQANVYFIEVSDECEDQKMMDWCEFLSFISHVTVFCSDEEPNQTQIDKFNKCLLTEYSSANLIICSPTRKQSIDTIKKPHTTVNITELNDNLLRNCIFNAIEQKKMMFMSSETVSTYSFNIISKKKKDMLQSDKTSFYNESMNNYSYQMKNDTIDHFHKLLQQTRNNLLSKIKANETLEDLNLNEQQDILIDKSLEFFFINLYSEIWETTDVKNISIIIRNEVKNDFSAEIGKIKSLKLLCKLNSIVKSGINETTIQEASKLVKELSTPGSIVQLKDVSILNDLDPRNIEKYENDVSIVFEKTIKASFAKEETQNERLSMIDEVNKFVEQNPTASDDEYKSFYDFIKSKYYSKDDPFIRNYIDDLMKIRPISSKKEKSEKEILREKLEREKLEHEMIEKEMKMRAEYEEQKDHKKDDDDIPKITIDADRKSFSDVQINVQRDTITTNINTNMSCHDLFEITRNLFSLNNTPFYLTKISTTLENQLINVQVFDDDTPFSSLNSDHFTVHYGDTIYSTQSAIESLSYAKTFHIADDFIIQTNSRNANYNVVFPPDHNGWFNVPFNITNNSPTRNTDIALITLKLTNEETSYLQEGNTLVHQYLQGNTWVTIPQKVFLSFPDCKKAVFLLPHCCTHRISALDTELSKLIPESHQNKNYSRNWEGMNPDQSYSRGGRPYYVPVGYLSVGIKVNSFDENTCVAFHGTKVGSVCSIIQNGFLLPSKYKGVRKNHISLSVTKYGIEHFADAIFVSPSILYSSLYGGDPIVASGKEGTFVESGHVEKNKMRIVILQIRVKPDSFTINENTTKHDIQDPHYKFDEQEWRISNPANLFPYRLLYKHMSIDDYYSSVHL